MIKFKRTFNKDSKYVGLVIGDKTHSDETEKRPIIVTQIVKVTLDSHFVVIEGLGMPIN